MPTRDLVLYLKVSTSSVQFCQDGITWRRIRLTHGLLYDLFVASTLPVDLPWIVRMLS